jgi:hypothetical protein
MSTDAMTTPLVSIVFAKATHLEGEERMRLEGGMRGKVGMIECDMS